MGQKLHRYEKMKHEKQYSAGIPTSTVGTMRPTKTRACDIANCFAFFVALHRYCVVRTVRYMYPVVINRPHACNDKTP